MATAAAEPELSCRLKAVAIFHNAPAGVLCKTPLRCPLACVPAGPSRSSTSGSDQRVRRSPLAGAAAGRGAMKAAKTSQPIAALSSGGMITHATRRPSWRNEHNILPPPLFSYGWARGTSSEVGRDRPRNSVPARITIVSSFGVLSVPKSATHSASKIRRLAADFARPAAI